MPEQTLVVTPQTIRPEHTMVKTKVTANNINDFYMLLDERRDIHWNKVKSMAKNLENGIHFESPIVINLTPNGKRVLDGNHRLESLKLFLEKFPNASVWINIAQYDSMNRADERVKYSFWNKGTKESANDYLKNYFKTLPFGEEMLMQLPVTLKSTGNILPLKLLVGAYVDSKKQGRYSGAYQRGGEAMVDDFSAITQEDITLIKAFISDMNDVFGLPLRKSKYYRSTSLPAFFRVWYDNRNVPYAKFKKAMKKIYAQWDEQFEEGAKAGGKALGVIFYNKLIATLKLENPRANFKSDLDILGANSASTEVPAEDTSTFVFRV